MNSPAHSDFKTVLDLFSSLKTTEYILETIKGRHRLLLRVYQITVTIKMNLPI